ncbi:MAG: hypothetical protein ACLSEY_09260 [Enterocloster sp.]
MAYKHGIEVTEKASVCPQSLIYPIWGSGDFGTAPVNLAKNPAAAVNRPLKVNTFEEAQEALGYSDDWEHYTLCQGMYASFQLFQIAPVIFINVLDPEKHNKELDAKAYPVRNHRAVVDTAGVLMDTVAVTAKMDQARIGSAVSGRSCGGRRLCRVGKK